MPLFCRFALPFVLGCFLAANAHAMTPVAPTITTTANNTLSGAGLAEVADGSASTLDTGVTDPTYQHVTISDITFTPIPEINPAWSAVGSCLLAGALILRHSAKFRK